METCSTCKYDDVNYKLEPCNTCSNFHDKWEPAISKKKFPKDPCVTKAPGFYSHKRWDDLLNTSVAQIKSLSSLKGGEYAGDSDRLANFRRNAAALGLPMETVWAVYSAKHWDAVMQYIKDLNEGKTRERLEPISGRVDDLLVYLLLFKAILEETSCP
jgi:hypothetical protein